MRRVKIVCTLGPASADADTVARLVAAGMDCARLNFSHGTHASHAELARLVRETAARERRSLALLADLCGPKMRVGRFAAGPVELREGAPFVLTTRSVAGDEREVSVSYEPLPRDARPGDTVLLDDGLLRLRVVETTATDVRCVVEVGGTLSDHKGIHLPGSRLSAPALTEKDRADLAFAVGTLDVDYVALSFVRRADDVRQVRELAGNTPIVAKIEKPEALDNLGEIVEAADGIMVARGDLGVELGAEKVPLVQKRIIREVNARGKLVITATQMLESMIRNPRPTRAEAADVANAVLDGTDAVMLSGETATGRYPVEAVRMMDAIVREVEAEWLSRAEPRPRTTTLLGDWGEWGHTSAVARAAALLSWTMPVRAIVCFTTTGRAAALLSEHRPRAPIHAVTPDPAVARRLALEWGVRPHVEVPPETMEETLRIATSLLVREGAAGSGDEIAIVAAWPPSERPNTVKLHRL